ncbi:MAG TPA: hypothetical protein VGK25_05235, partial [Ignavibacteria bacterium]
MLKLKLIKNLLFLALITVFSIYLSPGCNENPAEDTQTDDQFLQEVVTAGIGSNNEEEDDLMSGEKSDLDDGGAVDNGGGFDTPIDSLIKWGRRVISVNVNINITSEGDSLKNVNVTRTINGNFIIVGMVNGNLDTVVKPYTEVIYRTAVFKRIAHTPRPRFNWKVYKVSMADGGTTAPQNSNDYIQMQKIDVYVNGNLTYTFNGPDFAQNIFVTKRFGGDGIPKFHLGEQVRVVVTTVSQQSEQDIVAWHWARNTFGFHRVPFTMTSSIPNPNGPGYLRTFEKTVTIYAGHRYGV